MSTQAAAEFKKAQEELRARKSKAIAAKAVSILIDKTDALGENELIELAIQLTGLECDFACAFVSRVILLYPDFFK